MPLVSLSLSHLFPSLRILPSFLLVLSLNPSFSLSLPPFFSTRFSPRCPSPWLSLPLIQDIFLRPPLLFPSPSPFLSLSQSLSRIPLHLSLLPSLVPSGTISKGAALLHEEGASAVLACCTHAVFRHVTPDARTEGLIN